MVDLTKYTETQQFYIKIEKRYEHIVEKLLEEDCKKVEYLRGELAAYSLILKEYDRWNPNYKKSVFA